MTTDTDAVRKLYLLDTNVLLHEPLAIYAFAEHHVVVPMTVLEELDHIKDSKKDVSRDARSAIRAIDDVILDASPEEVSDGVPIPHREGGEAGHLIIFADHHLLTPEECVLPLTGPYQNDNRIINSALYLQRHSSLSVVLVTKDINMRLKAKGAGLEHVEDYRKDRVVEDIKLLTKGYHKFEGDFWQQFNQVHSQVEDRHTYHYVPAEQLPDTFHNEYLLDAGNDFAARVAGSVDGRIRLMDLGRDRLLHKEAWGVKPKNVYQGIALHALLDPALDMVIMTGPAGSGKTLLALAAALELSVEKRVYDKIIVTRNTPEIAESIGFLPGTEEEKMMPWLAAITDTLEVLHKRDAYPNDSLQYIIDKANIQFKSVNFMRGRSIQNAFVLVDEAQNLTASQLKTIITRCGEGTKLVCSGNLAQIDSYYLTPVTSGLAYIVERFKDFDGSASVYLNGVVRSRLASFAEENL